MYGWSIEGILRHVRYLQFRDVAWGRVPAIIGGAKGMERCNQWGLSSNGGPDMGDEDSHVQSKRPLRRYFLAVIETCGFQHAKLGLGRIERQFPKPYLVLCNEGMIDSQAHANRALRYRGLPGEDNGAEISV